MKNARLRIGAGVLLILLGLVQITLNPLAVLKNAISVNFVRRALPIAEKRWALNPVSRYQVDVEGYRPLKCATNARLTIKDGKLAGVAARRNSLIKDEPLVELAPQQWHGSISDCDYEEYLVDNMFVRVEESLSDINIWNDALRVEFDSQYGFVTIYGLRSDYHNSHVSECCIWFQYRNFLSGSP